MPVLIDGNNLLHAVRAIEDPERLFGRFMLNDALGRWVHCTGNRVHVVYDGPAPTEDLAQQLGHADIQMTFSGSGVTADAVLRTLLENDSAARNLLVVSSDHEVMRSARRRRARAIRSNEFWDTLQRDLARRTTKTLEPEEKKHGLEPDATEHWLREFGLDEGTADT